ncbi:hypothetical protein V6N11_064795 [Hibiscus sabdariffa]|uniref:Uncharacterized protein n=2 Tax=Hibiscus sabdariffa TaxID=183260 RepID=A0ABR2SJ08_9ROSI
MRSTRMGQRMMGSQGERCQMHKSTRSPMYATLRAMHKPRPGMVMPAAQAASNLEPSEPSRVSTSSPVRDCISRERDPSSPPAQHKANQATPRSTDDSPSNHAALSGR